MPFWHSMWLTGMVHGRVLARIYIPSGSWAWWVGVVTRTMTSSIEYLGTFVGENFLNWLKTLHEWQTKDNGGKEPPEIRPSFLTSSHVFKSNLPCIRE